MTTKMTSEEKQILIDKYHLSEKDFLKDGDDIPLAEAYYNVMFGWKKDWNLKESWLVQEGWSKVSDYDESIGYSNTPVYQKNNKIMRLNGNFGGCYTFSVDGESYALENIEDLKTFRKYE